MHTLSCITCGPCPHLDGKHIIFGRLANGMDTLDQVEKIEVDNNGQSIEAIRIERIYLDEMKPKQRNHSLDVLHEVCKIQQNK